MIAYQWEGPALTQTWMFKVKTVYPNPLKVMAVSECVCKAGWGRRSLGGEWLEGLTHHPPEFNSLWSMGRACGAGGWGTWYFA